MDDQDPIRQGDPPLADDPIWESAASLDAREYERLLEEDER